jgi:magnesium chelatase family protein
LLPPLDHAHALEVATIHDAAGVLAPAHRVPPVRAPHHGISSVGLVGGGSGIPTIGEITLAHRGILYLDELAEFRPSSIDALREPLEQGSVRLRRSRWQFEAPARFQLVAAMNLCRCGRYGNKRGPSCTCSEVERLRYWNRVSGALRSRFDLNHVLTPPEDGVFAGATPDVAALIQRINIARHKQEQRWGGALNAHARSMVDPLLRVTTEARSFLGKLAFVRSMSGRAQLATVRVARTIADLESSEDVLEVHVRRASRFAPQEASDDNA